MKKHFFLQALLCLCMTYLSGQNNTSFLQGENQLQSLYSNFEASDTPTGILYGQSLLTLNQAYYAFSHETPTHSRLTYEILHRSMYDCKSPNNDWLAAPDSLLTDIHRNYDEPSDVVDIVLAALHYNEIETAGNMDKIHMVNNSLAMVSGYSLTDVLAEKTAFASMLTKSRCFAGDVTFNLPTQNLQTNIPIDEINISMDGINFMPIAIGSSEGYTLTEGDNQIIYLQVSIGNDVITTTLLLDVINKKDFHQQNQTTKNPHGETFHTSLPDSILGRAIDGDYFGDSTIYATALLSCGSTLEGIQKPFIILDGIDLTWDQNISNDEDFFYNRLNFQRSGFFNSKSLRNYLIENEYDIIFVDYSDHHISIKDNAAAVIDLIEKINGYKEANGSTHHNKMMGFSMGGVVGKWALLDMEENNIDHDMDKYFTFDSPMSGGNISPALQGLIHQFSDILTTEVADNFQLINAITPFVGSAGDALGFITGTDSVLNSPSPSELLFYKYPSGENELITTSSTYLDFYGDFKTKGLQGDGTLVHAEYLSIANGSSLGGETTPQDVSANELMFQLDFDDPTIFNTPVFQELAELLIEVQQGNVNADMMDMLILLSFLLDWDIDIEGYALPGKDVWGYENKIYDGKIAIQGDVIQTFDIEIDSEYFAECSPNLKPLDSAPGGIIDIGSIIGAAAGATGVNIEEIANDIDGVTLLDPLAFCFIPTVSSLNVDKGNAPLNVGFMPGNVNMPVIRNQSPTINSRWVAVEEIPLDPQLNANTNHVALALNNICFLANELSGDYSLINGLDVGQSYNFGMSDSPFSYNPTFQANNTNHFIDHSLDIFTENEIFVNNAGAIGLLPALSNALDNRSDSHFDLYVRGKTCSLQDQIIVNFLSGSSLNIGDASIYNTADIHVDYAELILKSNATLNMDNNSSLIIEEDGLIEFQNGVNINMQASSEIDLLGTLRTTEDVTINIEGTIILHESTRFDLGGKLTINGVNINDELLRVHGNVLIHGDIAINNGRIELDKTGQLHFKPTQLWMNESVHLENIEVIQAEYNLDEQAAILIENKDDITIRNFIANNIMNKTMIDTKNANKSGKILIEEAIIHNVRHAVRCENVAQVEINDSEFTSATVSDDDISYEWFNGVFIENSNYASITHSSFSGFGEDDKVDADEYALRLIDNPIVEIEYSLFENNYLAIACPKDADGLNKTNLMLVSTDILNNHTGIEMYGFVSDIVTQTSSGFISMECTKVIDNYVGIKGEDILLQADNPFSNYEMTANTFQRLEKNQGGGFPLIFDIEYTIHDYEQIYLRGNVWGDFDDIGTFRNSSDNIIPVIFQPGIDLSSGESIPSSCSTIIQQDEDPCIGCFTEDDDNDCSFNIQGEQTNIAQNYRNAYENLRNKEYELASTNFEPLSTLEQSSFKTSTSKCNFMMDVARVFSLPNNDEHGSLSIAKRQRQKTTIYPNPSREFIQLENIADGEITIYSSTGNEVMRFNYQSGTTIDIVSLESGLYFIKSDKLNKPVKFVVLD